MDMDSWQFYWGGSKYSNRRIYREYIENPIDAPKPFHWLWKSCTLAKQKLFFWLLVSDMLNTRDLLTRKSFHIDSTKCVLCEDEPNEHLTHLFFSYDFSQNFWMVIGFRWNTDYELMEMLLEGKRHNNDVCFKECLIAGCCSIWMHRNIIIFDHKTKSILY